MGDRPTLIVEVPMGPPRELSPNARVNRYKRAAVARGARFAAWAATREARYPRTLPLFGSDAPLTVAIVVGLGRGQRRADLDNAIASCKAILDGMCDALGVDDRQIRGITLDWERDPTGRGFTRLAVTEDG